jgi:hypothetical protein
MATSTTRLGLRKPASTDTVSVSADLNANWDKVDTAVILGQQVVTTGITATNTTTLTNVPGLVVPLLANTKYAIEAWIWYTATVAADIKLSFTAPSGATLRWAILGVEVTDADQIGPIDSGVVGSGSLAVAGSALNGCCRPSGNIDVGATPGNLQLQMAQNTASTTGTVLSSGSWLRVTRLT